MPALLQPVELHVTFDLILLNVLRQFFLRAHSWLNWVELHVTELYQC